MLVPCGHTPTARRPKPYQRACILLAKNGMAAFCYDPIGQGERVQLLDDEGKPAIRRDAPPSTRWPASARFWSAVRPATYRIWDGIRGLDYLASRPEVDPSRLGCTGNSGGGTLTAYLMAPRRPHRRGGALVLHHLARAALRHDRPAGRRAEHHRPGRLRLDHADYVTMRAPKPTLICGRHAGLLRHPGELGHLPRGQADLRPARLRRARRSLRVGRAARLHQPPARRHGPLAAAVAAEDRRRDHRARSADRTGYASSSARRPDRFSAISRRLGLRPQRREREQQLRPRRTHFCRSSTASPFRDRIRELLGTQDGRDRTVMLESWTGPPAVVRLRSCRSRPSRAS